jgi:hypothetical protein
VAANLGWSHDDILRLTHRERQAWVAVIDKRRAT